MRSTMGKRKRNRHKRLFPVKFSSDYINVSRIDHNKATAYNAQRSKPVRGGRNNVEPIFNNSFVDPSEPIEHRERVDDAHSGISNPRVAKLDIYGKKRFLTVPRELEMKRTTVRTFDETGNRVHVVTPRALALEKKHQEIVKEKENFDRHFSMREGSLYKIWQGKRHQGVSTYSCQVYERKGNYILMLFFQGTEFIFV